MFFFLVLYNYIKPKLNIVLLIINLDGIHMFLKVPFIIIMVLTKLLPLDFYLRTVEFHHPTPHWSPESHQVLTEDLNLHPQYLKLSRFYHTIFTKSHNKNRLYIFNFSRIVPVEPPPPLAPPPGDLLRLLKSGCIGRDGALVSFMCIFGGSGCLDFFFEIFY